MCFADRSVVDSTFITLGFCATVLRADERVWHPICEKGLLTASSYITLAVAGAVSFVVLLGDGAELRSARVSRGLAGVVLTIGRKDPSGTYCLADMFVVAAMDLTPLAIGVTRSRPGMRAMSVGGHEEVDEVVGSQCDGLDRADTSRKKLICSSRLSTRVPDEGDR